MRRLPRRRLRRIRRAGASGQRLPAADVRERRWLRALRGVRHGASALAERHVLGCQGLLLIGVAGTQWRVA